MLKVHFSGHGGSIDIPLSLAAANFLPPAEYVLLCWGGTDVDHWYRQNEHAPCRVLDACDDATMPALDMPDTPPGLNAGMSINGDDHFELATTTEQTIDLIGPQYYGAAVDDQPVYVCGEQLPMTGYRMIRDIAAVAGDNEWVRQTGGQRSDGVCEWTVTSVGLSNLTSDAWPRSATIGQCPLDVYTSRKDPPPPPHAFCPPYVHCRWPTPSLICVPAVHAVFDNTTRGASATHSPTEAPTSATTPPTQPPTIPTATTPAAATATSQPSSHPPTSLSTVGTTTYSPIPSATAGGSTAPNPTAGPAGCPGGVYPMTPQSGRCSGPHLPYYRFCQCDDRQPELGTEGTLCCNTSAIGCDADDSTTPTTSAGAVAPEPTITATTVSHSAGQSGTGSGWYSGDGGANCDAACFAQGLVCTEQGLYDHNTEVNSSAAINALVQQHGEFANSICDGNYTTASDVPNWVEGNDIIAGGVCHLSGSRPLRSFNCSAQPPGPQGQYKRRLCFCLVTTSTLTAIATAMPPTSLVTTTSEPSPTRAQEPTTTAEVLPTFNSATTEYSPTPTTTAGVSTTPTITTLATTSVPTATEPTAAMPPTAATGSTAQSTDSAAGDDDGLSPWLIGIIAACALAAIGLVYFCCCVRNKQGGLDRGKPAHVRNPTYTDPHPHDQPQQQPYGVVSGLPSSTGGGGDGTAAYADIPATRSSQTAYDASASPDSGAGLQSVIRPNYATNYATLGGNRHSGAVVYSAGPQSTCAARPKYAEAADVTDGATTPPVAPVYAAVNRSGARDGRRSRSRGGNDDNADATGAAGTGYDNVAPSGFGDATTVDEGTAAIAPDYGSPHGAAGNRSRSAQGPGIYDRLGGSTVGAEVSPDDGLAAPVACAYRAPNGQVCRTIALTGSRQCIRHTCNTRGCSSSKSSRVDFCGDHADSSA